MSKHSFLSFNCMPFKQLIFCTQSICNILHTQINLQHLNLTPSCSATPRFLWKHFGGSKKTCWKNKGWASIWSRWQFQCPFVTMSVLLSSLLSPFPTCNQSWFSAYVLHLKQLVLAMLLYWRICMKTAMAWENNRIIQTVRLLLKSSKRFISETGENSTTLRILHQQPTTTNTLEIVATTIQKHFAHCSDNYTITLCTLLRQLCNKTLPIAVTTLKIAKKTLKHFADCRENSTHEHQCWKMQSQT